MSDSAAPRGRASQKGGVVAEEKFEMDGEVLEAPAVACSG